MENIKRILTGLVVDPIREKLAAHPEWWEEETLRQSHPGSYHKDTEVIYLLGPVAFTYDDVYNHLTWRAYPHWADMEEHMEALAIAMIQSCNLVKGGRILLAKLKPEGVIPEHVDEGPYAEHYSRFHIPITSNTGSFLSVRDDEQSSTAVNMAPGELWWFNHRRPHFATNGKSDRIHLIIDAVSEKYPVVN